MLTVFVSKTVVTAHTSSCVNNRLRALIHVTTMLMVFVSKTVVTAHTSSCVNSRLRALVTVTTSTTPWTRRAGWKYGSTVLNLGATSWRCSFTSGVKPPTPVGIRVLVGAGLLFPPRHTDRGPPSLLSYEYWGLFPHSKTAGAWSWPLISN
jgi:hypothetical protein